MTKATWCRARSVNLKDDHVDDMVRGHVEDLVYEQVNLWEKQVGARCQNSLSTSSKLCKAENHEGLAVVSLSFSHL